MSFIFTSIKFFDEFTGTGGGGTTFLNGNTSGKHTAVIQGYFYLAYLNLDLRFTAADKSIANINELDFRSFYDDGNFAGKGLKAGRTINIEGVGTYTVESISNDGRTIYVEEVIVDGDHLAVDLFDDTLIDAVDLYFNLIENSTGDNYLSLVDTNAIQKFSADGLAASDSDGGAVVNMLVAASSFGWVTNKLTDEVTGETDEVTVQGTSWEDHKQAFEFTQVFRIAPFAKADQINDIKALTPPEYFLRGRALKYICQVDGKFNYSDPEPAHSSKFRPNIGVSNASGLTCWYNDTNVHNRPDYTFESIAFEIDGDEASQIDINNTTSVTIRVKSRLGKFNNATTKFALDFFYFPLNESRFANTSETTMLQNYLNDRRLYTVGVPAGPHNGENYGTAYQVLTNVVFEYVDAETVDVTFDVEFSDEIKELFESLEEENRNYFFVVTTQDADITTTKQVDRVAILVPVATIGWNKSNPALIKAFDNIRVYLFPQIGIKPFTTVAGYEGDPFYVEFPFQGLGNEVDGVTPTIKSAGFQIVLKKTGKENFVLEEKIFDASLVRKLNGVQTIDIEEEKSYLDVPEEYNLASLKKDEAYDDIGSGSDEEDYYGFISHHASVLRYEYWVSLISQSEQFAYDIFKDLETATEAWPLLAAEGWELKLRFVAKIEGYTGFEEEFEAYWYITAKSVGDTPDSGPVFVPTVEYIDQDSGMIVNGIVKGGKTLIKSTFEGDFSSMPSGFNSLFGYVFADYEGGGVTVRRFGSTEFDSDKDSPFTDPGYTPYEGSDISHSWASKNVRITLVAENKAIVETIYDDSKTNWGEVAETLLVYPKVGFMYGCFIETEDGGYVLTEEGQRTILEDCEEDISS